MFIILNTGIISYAALKWLWYYRFEYETTWTIWYLKTFILQIKLQKRFKKCYDLVSLANYSQVRAYICVKYSSWRVLLDLFGGGICLANLNVGFESFTSMVCVRVIVFYQWVAYRKKFLILILILDFIFNWDIKIYCTTI